MPAPGRGLYSEAILDHFRRPHNKGALESPDIAHEGVNPLCGDRIRIELSLDGDTVTAARFRGDLCAVATASASILTDLIHDRTLAGAAEVDEGRLLEALGADVPPARRQCVRLPLDTLRAGIRRFRVESGRAD